MLLEAGELDQRVTLESESQKIDASGERGETWQQIGTYWGKLAPLTPKNVELAKGYAATVNYDCKLRYRAEATTSCRVVIKGEVYTINGVVHGVNKDWTQLFLTKVEGE